MRGARAIALLSIVATGGACASILGLDSGAPLDPGVALDAGPDAQATTAEGDGSVGSPPQPSTSTDAALANTSLDGSTSGNGTPDASTSTGKDAASPVDSAPAADTACVPEPPSQTCAGKQCGTAVNLCGETINCGADGGTGCAAAKLCSPDDSCCAQPASCNATTACCPGTFCWAGDTLADDGTCQATACPGHFAPCVAVGDCCFGFVCQGNTSSGYFCE